MRCARWLLLAGFVLAPTMLYAEVKPHPLFTDNMVLQADMECPIWGKADPGEDITIEFHKTDGKSDSKIHVKADGNGKWLANLPATKAGTTWQLTFKGKDNTVTCKNVLIGEVWICSGQSNMQWSINQSADPQEVIKNCKNPHLRLFYVTRTAVPDPAYDFGKPAKGRDWENKWSEADEKSVPEFSAVAYHFGNALQKARNVPVGLIHTSWGGTPAEAWTSRESLLNDSALRYYVERLDERKKSYDPDKAKKQYEEALTKWKQDSEKAKAEKKQEPRRPVMQLAPGNMQNDPSSLYNGMIAPLIPFAIKGAIWYQGEANATRAFEYRMLFPAMISDWRKNWKLGDFPFFCVQLAPYNAGNSNGVTWPELREAQLLASMTLKNVGMAVITDVGEEKDIHPKQKKPVGERLALAARGIAYGESIEYSGPLYQSLKVEDSKAILSFTHIGKGLECKGDKLMGFTICGDDKTFHDAEAKIEGDKVVVTCPHVNKPVAVRYGWKNFPVVNLWNKDGLPASPFRTDDFPLTTAPKK